MSNSAADEHPLSDDSDYENFIDDALDMDGVEIVLAPGSSGQVAHTVHGGMHQNYYLAKYSLSSDLDKDYLRRQTGVFIDPGFRDAAYSLVGIEQAMKTLEKFRCVVLVGNQGIGRYTAALEMLRRTVSAVYELRFGKTSGQNEPITVDDLPIRTGAGCVLELPQRASDIETNFGKVLFGRRTRLEASNSYLVVVATSDVWTKVGGAWDLNVLRVCAPDRRAVLRAHLAERLEASERARLDESMLFRLIADAPLGDVVRLAGIAAFAATSDTIRTDDIMAEIESEFANWRSQIADWFESHADVRERLFLLASATLEEWRADFVLKAAESLGVALGERVLATGGLSDAGINELAVRIDAEITATGAVRFQRHQYSLAVIEFVCQDRTEQFRRRFWNWIAEFPLKQRGRTVVAVAERIGTVLLGISTRQRGAEAIVATLRSWSSHTGLRNLLVEIVAAAAIDPQSGPSVRRMLYNVADRHNDVNVLAAVAAVCGSRFGDLFPGLALKRLERLAIRDNGELDRAIMSAVLALWGREHTRSHVLKAVVGWMDGHVGYRFSTGCLLLATLNETSDFASRFLATAISIRTDIWLDLANAIGCVLDIEAVTAYLQPTLHAWFRIAAHNELVAAELIDLMVLAVGRAPLPVNRAEALAAVAYAWQPFDGQRAITPERQFRDWLLARIHSVTVVQ